MAEGRKHPMFKLGQADGIQDKIDGIMSLHPNNDRCPDTDMPRDYNIQDTRYWSGYYEGYWSTQRIENGWVTPNVDTSHIPDDEWD